ncbi:hypothetical protein SAMN05660420_01426 [Desulfuromusa kysingii]|uniref:Helix-turn-helix domain-containing protein n=2 Tax=Desulfuromusa kysingii TaxID=37625 RepID=A0A1H3YY85_9BACT|nr:hypothetical protein SAMN05660420_01426 [Desulfuromusa kysingii]
MGSHIKPDFDNCDLLTVEDFAEKMKVAKSTAHDWIASGELVDGKHYVRIRSVIRILWPTVIEILYAEANEKRLAKPEALQLQKSTLQEGINLSYGK